MDATLPPSSAVPDARLPPAVAAALAAAALPDLEAPRDGAADVGGTAVAYREWGAATDPPVLLVHGVGGSLETWWRVAPALAAAPRRVVAIDLPGHGRTPPRRGSHRFRAAAELVAGFCRGAGLAPRAGGAPDLRVVGHSWGAMAAAALPLLGLRPGGLVLLDPPAVPAGAIATMADDPTERRYEDLDEAIAAIRATYPGWPTGDVLAKAVGLHLVDEATAQAVLRDNGDWDGGRADLAAGARGPAGLPETWLVRGDPAAGGLVLDAALPGLAEVVGAGRIVTIADAPHSPQRTHPDATVAALLRGIGAMP